MKIKIEVDGLTLEHATELTKFLSSLKPLEGIEQDTRTVVFNKEEAPSIEEKPKQTRKKAEKVETLSPEDFVKESANAFKNAIEEVKTEIQDVKESIEAQKVEAIEVVEPETVSAPTLMQIRSLVAQKAGEHKDAIKAKLVELGAQNVSTLDAKHFQTIFDFLNEL
jgi:hypothetical protein